MYGHIISCQDFVLPLSLLLVFAHQKHPQVQSQHIDLFLFKYCAALENRVWSGVVVKALRY